MRNTTAIVFRSQTRQTGTDANTDANGELSGFVANRRGEVYAFTAPASAGRATLPASPALDLSNDTGVNFEWGLLGMAFAPAEDWLYIHRTNASGSNVLTAHAVSGNSLGPAVELLRISQPFANHNGGDIVFDHRGYLYTMFGDGGSANDPLGSGQDLSTPLGAILRLAVDPTAAPNQRALPAPGNPYIGVPGADERIWASGVRNAFRMSFDSVEQQLWVADVGQSCTEEVTVLDLGEGQNEGGADLGWDVFEGTRQAGGKQVRPHREPDFEYRQDSGSLCAVIGGQVYRGENLPALRGLYVWADLCARRVYASQIVGSGGGRGGAGGSTANSAAIDLGVQTGPAWGFYADPLGEVYLVDSESGVFRLAPAS